MNDSPRFSLLQDFLGVMAAPASDVASEAHSPVVISEPPLGVMAAPVSDMAREAHSPVVVLEPPLPDLRVLIAKRDGSRYLVPSQFLDTVRRLNSRRRLIERLSGLDIGI